MNRVPLLRPLLVGCVLLCWARAADAQYLQRPALSPYLYLNRRDPGPLGPYLSYVRPQQQLRSALSQQSRHLQQQQASIRSLRQQVTQIGETGSLRPTGTGSVFMNYSHYYPGFSGVSPRRGGSRGYSVPPARRGAGRSYY
jgi:hypothetical protein